MSLDEIAVGDHGYSIIATYLDEDTEDAVDLSAYTGSQVIQLLAPDGEVSTLTATFDSDGSDGQVTADIADGDIDAAGVWGIRVRVTIEGGAQLTSDWTRFVVV